MPSTSYVTLWSYLLNVSYKESLYFMLSFITRLIWDWYLKLCQTISSKFALITSCLRDHVWKNVLLKLRAMISGFYLTESLNLNSFISNYEKHSESASKSFFNWLLSSITFLVNFLILGMLEINKYFLNILSY